MISGYVVALVTPFHNGRIDFESFERYVNFISSSGVSGMVVCGSTGESLSLSFSEKEELIRVASEVNNGRIKLFAGLIDSYTENCVKLVKSVEHIVNGFLSICPFYVKPSQNQIFEHFKSISNSTEKDIIIYNNPGRVGVDISFEAFCKSASLKNVVGIKECSSDLSRFSMWKSGVRDGFSFLSGNDDTACGAFAMGADGVISVSANVVPELCVKMFNAFFNGDIERFSVIRSALAPLHQLMFAEPSPAPAKYALQKIGLMHDEVRAPLSTVSDALKVKIDETLEKIGLIK